MKIIFMHSLWKFSPECGIISAKADIIQLAIRGISIPLRRQKGYGVFMQIQEAIKKRRSIRCFKQTAVAHADLLTLVDHARMSASGANMQPLKFAILDDPTLVKQVFPYVKWAGYLPDWTPMPSEAPPAYIAVFGDTAIKNSFETDAGAAITTMMLSALDLGLSTCWLGAINRDALFRLLQFPASLQLLYLLAVGYGAQTSTPCTMEKDSCKYFFDEQGVLQVPKRALSDVLINL